MIHLTASARYGYGGKQFIARIVGRDPKFTFNREFIGRKGGKRNESSEADVDDPGLYELRDIDSKGRPDDTYVLLLTEDAGGLKRFNLYKEDAMKIAKELGAGRRFEEIVAVTATGWCFVTAKEAEKKEQVATIETATVTCWAVLQALPEKEAKKVLAALKLKVSPPKEPEPAPALPAATEEAAKVADPAPVEFVAGMTETVM